MDESRIFSAPGLSREWWTLPAQLERMRVDAGLSRVELGERIGASQGYVRTIEEGQIRYLSGLHLDRWAEACGYVFVPTFMRPGPHTAIVRGLAAASSEDLDLLSALLEDWYARERLTDAAGEFLGGMGEPVGGDDGPA